jgi:D-cysteine desulfhydrase
MVSQPGRRLAGVVEPQLHRRYPALAPSLPHVALGERPTPVRRLGDLESGGAEIWMKDDGAFGSGGWGGNKVRKLEWLIPEARRRRAPAMLTFGGLGTNWGLAAALYGREHGVATALALLDQPVDEHVRAQLARLKASGAALHFTHSKPRTIALLPWLVARHSRRGRIPYVLPAGGSSAVGALGYVEAALEIAAQVEEGELPEPSHAIVAVGSGGTAAGLMLGLRLAGLTTRVVGIVVNDKLRLDAHTITRLALRSAHLLERRGAELPALSLAEADATITDRFIGPGYGAPTAASQGAIERAAATGLRLDPVYTAKAMSGLLALDAEGFFGKGPVLFVHTDGPRA